MTSTIQSRVTINAHSDTVFKYLVDTTYHFLWNPHLQSLTPRGRLKQGSSYSTTSLFMGVKVSGKNQVTRINTNKEIQIENSTGTLKYIVNYRLQSRDQITILLCKTKVIVGGNSFAFSLPILKLLARRELQSDLKALKLAAENEL